jgi:hypothetical protein
MDKILAAISMLCMPRRDFTTAELEILGEEYNSAPVPVMAFAHWRLTANSEEHIRELTQLMAGFPEWKISERARAVLNGDKQPLRWIGYSVYKALAYKSQCVCCIGWRVTLWTGLMLTVGALLGHFVKV